MQPGIDPERTGPEENPAQNHAHEKKIRAATGDKITVDDRKKSRAQRTKAAPGEDRLVVERLRNLQEMGEHEDQRRHHATPAPSDVLRQLEQEETAEDRFFDRRDQEGGRQGHQHAGADLRRAEMRRRESIYRQVQADHRLGRDEGEEIAEAELEPGPPLQRPELPEGNISPEKRQRGQRGKKQRPVHRAMKRQRIKKSDHEIDQRPQHDRAEKDDREKPGHAKTTGRDHGKLNSARVDAISARDFQR